MYCPVCHAISEHLLPCLHVTSSAHCLHLSVPNGAAQLYVSVREHLRLHLILQGEE